MTDVTGSGEYYTGIAIGDMGNGKYSASRSLFVNHLPNAGTTQAEVTSMLHRVAVVFSSTGDAVWP